MSDWPQDQCDTCHAPIIWTHTTNAKRMPVDYEPSPQGNIALRPGGMGPVSVVLSIAKQFGRKNLYTSHFMTCPEANSWRKRNKEQQ